MSERPYFIALRSGLFLMIPGFIAWLFGKPLLFPSLGPTAYVLAFNSTSIYKSKTIIGGHFCGVVGGLASYHLIAAPYDLALLTESLSFEGIMLSIGSIVAVIITVFLMLYFEASHPPACATTLIISLGILSSWLEAVFILIAVAVMYLCYRLLLKLEGRFLDDSWT